MELISVVIPVYNRAQVLPETLDSVLSQTYTNWECIIIDDGSIDETPAIIEKYIKKEPRFYSIKNKDTGNAARARNLGIQAAKGKFIQFLDSDDVLADNKIQEQITMYNSSSNSLAITTCPWEFFEKVSDKITVDLKKPDFRSFDDIEEYFDLIGKIGGFYPPHCFLIPRQVIEMVGYWNENLSLNDDGEFFFRCMINSSKIIFCKDTYVRYRNKSRVKDNVSILNSEKKAISLVNSWKIIEVLYITKFGDQKENLYLQKKKQSVYSEIKRTFPYLIQNNKCFFRNELKSDTLSKRINNFSKRLKRRLKR